MKAKLRTRCMGLCIALCLTLIFTPFKALAEAPNAEPTAATSNPGSSADFLKQDSGMLDEQTAKVEEVSASIFWIMFKVFVAVDLISLLGLMIACLTNIGGPMTRANLKPTLLIWAACSFIGYAAFGIVGLVENAGNSFSL